MSSGFLGVAYKKVDCENLNMLQVLFMVELTLPWCGFRTRKWVVERDFSDRQYFSQNEIIY